MDPNESHPDSLEGLTAEQLRERVAECEMKLNQIGALVSLVRHEINNPLTGVLGQAQLLLRQELSDNVKERVRKIEELALRINEVAGRLREVPGPAFPPQP